LTDPYLSVSVPRPLRLAPTVRGADDFGQALRRALLDAHRRSAKEPIVFPSAHGAFSDSYFVPPPPVVPDASRLRNDILYACRNEQRTTLVTAANAGLFRLFCAQHVVDEVVEHSADWTDGSPVSRTAFLRRWVREYLPVIRVVRSDDELLASLLSPDEATRIAALAEHDLDDVPSATLALVLGAFYLSNDSPALRAVYGPEADLTEHGKWVEVLKAGGDAGELGRMFHAMVAMAVLLGGGLATGVKRVATALGPWGLVPLGLGAALVVRRTSEDTKHRLKSAAASAGTTLLEMCTAYQEVLTRFERTAPTVPGWEALAAANDPDAVLIRACLHTLARSPVSDRSAEELARQLPLLDVPQGEAKVRRVLRTHGCFFEVWRGRWQVGEVAELLAAYLDRLSRINA
jgi:hypothetical protein